MTLPYLNFIACCTNLQYSGFSINYLLEDFVVGETYYFNTISGCNAYEECGIGVSQDDCCPPNFPTLSGCFTLESYGFLKKNPFYTYWELGESNSYLNCDECLAEHPCTITTQIYFFKKCCETGNQNNDFFGMEINLGEIWENETYYIESEYFTGCATSLPIGEQIENVPIYTPNSYSFVFYPSCIICTGSTIGCNTTPPPTPTIYYSSTTTCGDGILKRNECDPIVIFPMGVECVIVNPTNTRTSDGRLSLLITGGTPPYTVLWDNGISAPALANLGVGTYTATVTDSYGDFIIIHSCNLTAPTPTPTPEPTPTPICENLLVNGGFDNNLNGWSLTYEDWVWSPLYDGSAEFIDQDNNALLYQDILTVGCTYKVNIDVEITNENASTKVLVGDTISEDIITSGSYTFTLLATNNTTFGIMGFNNTVDGGVYIKNVLVCVDGQCPINPNLCLSYSQTKSPSDPVRSGISTLLPNGEINGYPSWKSSDGLYDISWSIVNNRWQVTTTEPTWRIMINTNPATPPISGWYSPGENVGDYVEVTAGDCTSPLAKLSLNVITNDTVKGNDGNITLNATGGYTPYQYSIDDGKNYQNSPLFNKLSAGTYTTKVEDISGLTATKTVILK